jgi:GNAT superfamily N-acetyltransferase
VTDATRLAAATIRAATLDDVLDIRSILAEHGNDGPHPTVDIVGPYVRHLIASGRALVSVEGDVVVGFGATVATRAGRHLADLFVRSDRLGQGIGRPLLDAAFGGDWPRTTFASDDPRALPLYVRAGMSPLWLGLYVMGSGTSLPEPDRGLTAESADASRLANLEVEWSGVDRTRDHEHWASQAEADSFVILDGGDAVAAGNARARQKGSARVLNRLLIRPGADPLGPILVALRRAARGGQVTACIPSPNVAVRTLLEAGFRIEERDTFMASGPDLVDPDRLLPNSGLL